MTVMWCEIISFLEKKRPDYHNPWPSTTVTCASKSWYSHRKIMLGGYLLYTDFFPSMVCETESEGHCYSLKRGIGQRFLNQFNNLI